MGREEISMNNPTILRTRHKFGDYLSQPDIAKFELPKKMSRPWIVNNAYEEEKLKTLIVTETPVEASEVMLQIKEVKAERRKHVGYNMKQKRGKVRKGRRKGGKHKMMQFGQTWLKPLNTCLLLKRTTRKKRTGTLRWSSRR